MKKVIYNAYDMEHDDFLIDDILTDIRERCDAADGIIIRGRVGLWNGTFDAGAVLETFNDFYYKAVRDCDYLNIYDENGDIIFEFIHHDGTNVFTLRTLTARAMRFYKAWERGSAGQDIPEKDLHAAMWKNSFFCHKLHYFN